MYGVLSLEFSTAVLSSVIRTTWCGMSELSGNQTRAGKFLFIKFKRIRRILVFSAFVGSDVRFLPISTSDFINSFCGASLAAWKFFLVNLKLKFSVFCNDKEKLMFHSPHRSTQFFDPTVHWPYLELYQNKCIHCRTLCPLINHLNTSEFGFAVASCSMTMNHWIVLWHRIAICKLLGRRQSLISINWMWCSIGFPTCDASF